MAQPLNSALGQVAHSSEAMGALRSQGLSEDTIKGEGLVACNHGY